MDAAIMVCRSSIPSIQIGIWMSEIAKLACMRSSGSWAAGCAAQIRDVADQVNRLDTVIHIVGVGYRLHLWQRKAANQLLSRSSTLYDQWTAAGRPMGSQAVQR
jgi:hypothetical protein